MLFFLVKEREIYYTDRKWKAWIRCLPQPDNFLKVIRESRNRLPASLIHLFNFTEQELAQYNAAKDEEELADIVVFDAKMRGCKLTARVKE